MLTNKEKYRRLCEEEESIPIFSQAWWLDSVAKDKWDVVLIENGDRIDASLPYVLDKKYGFTLITQPKLTQTLGPWIRESKAKYARRLSREKDLLQGLFALLPKHDYYAQNWHYSMTNWLPLYWQGYEQTTRYTYRIDNIVDFESMWGGFEANIRTDIRKAINREGITIKTDLPFEEFISLNKKVFERQGVNVPYSSEFIVALNKAAKKREASKTFIAVDSEGNKHAGIYLVWDKNSAYYLMGGGDPELRNSGATSLCMWEAIKFASTVTKSFDFEGSMIEPVERFFRGFGSIQTPYFSVKKTNSKLLKAYRAFKNIY